MLDIMQIETSDEAAREISSKSLRYKDKSRGTIYIYIHI